MHCTLLRSLVGSGFFLFSLAASAQTLSQPVRTPYYSQDEIQVAHSIFDRAQSDLSRAQTNASQSKDLGNDPGDSPRYDIARTQLARLERSWDQGKFDSRQMSDTISALQMVLRDNHLLGSDRDLLGADVSRLLDFKMDYYG
jgi:hypothetical protein